MAAVIYSLMASTYWNGGMDPDFVICVSAVLGLGLELLLHLGG